MLDETILHVLCLLFKLSKYKNNAFGRIHLGITVRLDTVVLCALETSPGVLWSTLIFTLLILGHNFFFRLDASSITSCHDIHTDQIQQLWS